MGLLDEWDNLCQARENETLTLRSENWKSPSRKEKRVKKLVALVSQGYAARFYSNVLGREAWLVKDKDAKERIKARSWYGGDPILTLDEVKACSEYFEERAAILEFEAGFSRVEAERRAREEMVSYLAKLSRTCPPGTPPTILAGTP